MSLSGLYFFLLERPKNLIKRQIEKRSSNEKEKQTDQAEVIKEAFKFVKFEVQFRKKKKKKNKKKRNHETQQKTDPNGMIKNKKKKNPSGSKHGAETIAFQ